MNIESYSDMLWVHNQNKPFVVNWGCFCAFNIVLRSYTSCLDMLTCPAIAIISVSPSKDMMAKLSNSMADSCECER